MLLPKLLDGSEVLERASHTWVKFRRFSLGYSQHSYIRIIRVKRLQVNFLLFVQESSSQRVRKVYKVFLCVPSRSTQSVGVLPSKHPFRARFRSSITMIHYHLPFPISHSLCVLCVVPPYT